ncbi:hypothetical protein DFJ63DRAFT_229338 [Scheffersomyces coipomensis]|uniref:uncharacterized protein n=1 Tax=Scheffersomyces coipomensis TaxID=1788519 RepID=UPI00315C920B
MAPAATSKKSAGAASSSSLAKSIRSLSFKARFRFSYGYNNDIYEYITKYRTAWEKSLFYIDEKHTLDQIKQEVIVPKELISVNIKQLHIPDAKFKGIDKNQIQNTFQSDLVLSLKKGSTNKLHTLKISQPFSLDSVSRKGYLLNTGGHITSTKWLYRKLDESIKEHYLAVSIIYGHDGIENTINNEELSLFPTLSDQKNIKSGIQIWKYNLQDNKLEMIKFYITTDIGATNNLNWLPINIEGDKKSLGVLVGSFTDGKVHLIKVTTNGPQFAELIKPSFSYSIPVSSGIDIVSVTTFDFIGHDKILVGLSDGCIAEFILPYYKLESQFDENDVLVPSFISKVASSAISSLVTAEPEPDHYVIVINSLGIQSLAFEYSNSIQGLILPLSAKSSITPTYNPALQTLIGTPNQDTLGFNFIRSPHEGSNLLIKLDSFITSTKTSERLGHPLTLTGTSGGDLFVVNHSRKFLNGGKPNNKMMKILKLWKLRLKESLELSADYELIPSEEPSQFPVEPAQTVISSISWNENATGSSLYSAGTLSGLLIVERLDPEA